MTQIISNRSERENSVSNIDLKEREKEKANSSIEIMDGCVKIEKEGTDGDIFQRGKLDEIV